LFYLGIRQETSLPHRDWSMNRALVKAIGKKRQTSGRKSQIKVKGMSMEPTLSEGDGLVVRHIGPEDLSLGDIGVFWTGKVLLVHRVIGVKHWLEDTRFILKGDRLLYTEDMGEEFLFGKVVEVHHKGKRICFESGFWRWFNKVFGYFWRLNDKFLMVLRKMEERALGDWKGSTRLLPSRVFCFLCVLFHNKLTNLFYLLHFG